jgi:hypothetical protein
LETTPKVHDQGVVLLLDTHHSPLSSMTTPYKYHASSVVPAQLAFLAIYNPTLGPTDETFADQLVFWYSRKASDARRADKSSDAAGNARRKAADREEENERLRQIGLAQGMIGFAKTFSDGEKPVDSIETDKSRIVLHELENGWWVLASIDLTRLPAPMPVGSSKTKVDPKAKPVVEYSMREVSPPALLTQQLKQAHWLFLLHHGPTLDELFVKLSRDKFCSMLERYWMRFARSWDVLLHGNPAVDVFGGIKLAAGGELGVGVGEEEWGSGEREVLEDLTRRTEGLVDVVVTRFGESMSKEESSATDTEVLPWLGSGNVPAASDGVIFSGLNNLNRSSVRSISLWMQQIYAHGDNAYGAKDNPHRERWKRRKRNPVPDTEAESSPTRQPRTATTKEPKQNIQTRQETTGTEPPLIDPDLLPKDDRPQMYDRVASYDHATGATTPQTASHPNIPPPVVSAAEKALNKATKEAEKKSSEVRTVETEDTTTMGIPDQYMKYMTFGLSSLAKSYTRKTTEIAKTKAESTKKAKPSESGRKSKVTKQSEAPMEGKLELSHAEPIPDGEELRAKIAQQIHAENNGQFIVGLKGDLTADSSHKEDDVANMTGGSFGEESGGSRILLRTLHVELTPKVQNYTDKVNEDLERSDFASNMTGHLAPENPATEDFTRLRVLIYVHRPFMSLSYSSLYKLLHNTLSPIHKRLLSSTGPEKVAQRIDLSHHQQQAQPSAPSNNTNSHNDMSSDPENTIFSLIYDPITLSLNSSIPNIPPPGDYKPWPRIDALNVHTTLLASLSATSGAKGETALERTSKTARGWWVVWLRMPPSIALDDARPGAGGSGSQAQTDDGETQEGSGYRLDSQGGALSTLGLANSVNQAKTVGQTHRVAFLVRKVGENSSGSGGSASGAGQGKGRLGSAVWSSLSIKGVVGGGAGGGSEDENPAALGGGGFGIDARRYVEGLLSLNR